LHRLLSTAFVLGFGLILSPALPALAAGSTDGSSEAGTNPAAYAEAEAVVKSGNYAAALGLLAALVKAEPQNADAWNLLGFTYRKLGQVKESDAAYLKVLAINPDHLGALEYQGELFIATGRIAQAKANLAKLRGLCGTCEEAEDLAKALTAAGA
jgi:Flp pilus assembly protein TadD